MSEPRAVEFEYRLIGTGWSEARFAIGKTSVALTASYLQDALGDLLGALLRIALGDQTARCLWEEEPGEYHWRLTRNDDRVRVQILAFDFEGDDDLPEGEGRLVFDDEGEVRAVIAAVVAGAERVLAEYGKAGYHDKWAEHRFPAEELEQLKQLGRSGPR